VIDARQALSGFDGLILDMDGVVTDTASVHSRVWKQVFDAFLVGHQPGPVDPFTDDDYLHYVDGRTRWDGVVTFLASRDLALPPGAPLDPSGEATSWALANRKNDLFLAALEQQGVRAFPTTLDLVRRRRAHGVRTAVVTASRNAGKILAAAGVEGLFDAVIDGSEIERLGLAGKPDPATFVEAAHRLDLEPARCVVVEDALAGVEAGRRGGFGLVVGVDRVGQADALKRAGADVVVADLAELDQDGPWILSYSGSDDVAEGARETLLTLGNGYLGTRGALPEATADEVHYPGTYVAGIYNRVTSDVEGRVREDESIVNLPNWLPVTFRVAGGDWLAPTGWDVPEARVDLDLRRGVLHRHRVVVDGAGRRSRLSEERLVSMAAPHVAALRITVTPENWSGRVEIRSVLDGRVTNGNVASLRALSGQHLLPVGSGRGPERDTMWLEVETMQSRVRVVEAARTRLFDAAGAPLGCERHDFEEQHQVGQDLGVDLAQGEPAVVEKVVTVYTSRDRSISEPLRAALDDLALAGGFDRLVADHARAWGHLWNRFLIVARDGETEGLAVNLDVFHVLQTVSQHTIDLDVGIPARGLHGEGYQGHVFWDELFVHPLFDLRLPELSRSLLLYRCRRLSQARRRAARLGYRGALFPWQSGSDGREETPDSLFNPRSGRWMPDNSQRQYHVNLAVAWDLWHYWEITGDLAFLATHGAEALVEMARFWASFATYDPVADRYDLRGVMGPDEFHDGYPGRPGTGIDNSAYVNVLTAWTLNRARDVYDLLGRERAKELWERLALAPEELARWEHIARRLRVPFMADGLIAAFEGYEDLAELDWAGYRARYGDIGRLDLLLEAEGDSTNRFKLSKQADVLMLFYLFSAEELTALVGQLGYHFDPATIPATVDHYLARTSHGSTLSRVAHAWVLARTDRRRSWSLLGEALGADLADTGEGSTREGIHLGGMAGALDILQRCYTGLDARDDVLRFNPQLPDELASLELNLLYRDQRINVHADHDELRLAAVPSPGPAVQVALREEVLELAPGSTLRLPLRRPLPPREGPVPTLSLAGGSSG
jgi:beta-phosphoglucomutase family hydrolase